MTQDQAQRGPCPIVGTKTEHTHEDKITNAEPCPQESCLTWSSSLRVSIKDLQLKIVFHRQSVSPHTGGPRVHSRFRNQMRTNKLSQTGFQEGASSLFSGLVTGNASAISPSASSSRLTAERLRDTDTEHCQPTNLWEEKKSPHFTLSMI